MKYLKFLLIMVSLSGMLTATATADVRQHQQVVVPSGTAIHVRMIDSINSDRNRAGEIFKGSLDHAVQAGNQTVFPRGATAYVKLVEASSAGRVKGRNELRLQLDHIAVGNQTYAVHSNVVDFRGKSQAKKTAKSAGIGAAVGGGVGALLGGGKGLAVGAGLGAGTGVATRAVKEPKAIQINSESLLQFHLAAPLRISR